MSCIKMGYYFYRRSCSNYGDCPPTAWHSVRKIPSCRFLKEKKDTYKTIPVKPLKLSFPKIKQCKKVATVLLRIQARSFKVHILNTIGEIFVFIETFTVHSCIYGLVALKKYHGSVFPCEKRCGITTVRLACCRNMNDEASCSRGKMRRGRILFNKILTSK